jgi:nucleotide-binding universal stress UspA family protein
VAPVGYAARTAPEPEAVGCAYDASPEAERALRLAAELARGGRRTLRVVTVHEPILIPEFGRSSRPLDERLRASLEEGLAAAVETSGLGDAAEPVLRRGAPAAELADESEGLGLLVMGSRGYGPVGAVLLGSVAARVVRESACPVIVVPRQG